MFDSDNSNDVQIKRLTNFFFRFFVFSPPSKPPPMNRHRTYCQMNPLTGIWPAYGNALGYRYVSPDGDGQSFTITTTLPRCDGSTTIFHSPFFILNWSHTFSAKEKDVETGLSYFGSRYYSSDLSIWLSVDPMSDKYPSLSPYVYCANNPVKLVDPNGEEIRKYVDYNTGEFLGEIDDGIDETLRVTKEDYEILKNRYDYDISNGNTDLPLYNGCLERNSIGKKGYDIAQIALSYKGSTQWAYSVRKDNFAAGKNKCNKFIYDVLLESNASASYSGRAPLAGEWADPKVMIPDWAVVTGSPRVEDVIAGGHSFEDASGHVAIVTHVFESGYIETMSANKSNVQIETFGNSVLKNKGKWGKTTYKPITIRRYTE